MKVLASAMLLGSALVGSAPASAQTYDPRFPVCMHVYGEKVGERMDCIFTSIAQCQATASGLPAVCITNPYADAKRLAPVRPHRAASW
jgi:hypothetical protein